MRYHNPDYTPGIESAQSSFTLSNAASIASLLLTTEAVLTKIPEEKADAGMAPPDMY
ncbi:MAG: hypothetical protein NUW37_07665 [Planctomycetes bacterium]|nr:hypothetical protein [Planctomycetota bacterium]